MGGGGYCGQGLPLSHKAFAIAAPVALVVVVVAVDEDDDGDAERLFAMEGNESVEDGQELMKMLGREAGAEDHEGSEWEGEVVEVVLGWSRDVWSLCTAGNSEEQKEKRGVG